MRGMRGRCRRLSPPRARGSAQSLGELTTMKKVRRVLVAMVGGTVLALGIALVVLPGPAFLVIPAGLAILAVEFAWARRWLRRARGWLPGKPVRGGAGEPPVPPGDSPGGGARPSVRAVRLVEG